MACIIDVLPCTTTEHSCEVLLQPTAKYYTSPFLNASKIFYVTLIKRNFILSDKDVNNKNDDVNGDVR